MSKPVIAIDIDDVLSSSAEDFIRFSNDNYGTNFKITDYTEHWAHLWGGVSSDEVHRRANAMDAAGLTSQYKRKDNSHEVLQHLSKKYSLVAMTSRRASIEPQTRAWIEEQYGDVFHDVKFAGIFDGHINTDTLKLTKADLFTSNSVKFVIDDQPKHCIAAAELGMKAILFGDYSWNQMEVLPDGVTRCADWKAVQEYFDA